MKLIYLFIFGLFFINPCDARDYVGAEQILQMSQGREKSLTWGDIDTLGLNYDEVGSGLYIRQYKLNDGNILIMGGRSLKEPPLYIYITNNEGETIQKIKEFPSSDEKNN